MNVATPNIPTPIRTLSPQPKSRAQRGTLLAFGAGRGNRTPKGRSPADFESAASASSAIPAGMDIQQKTLK